MRLVGSVIEDPSPIASKTNLPLISSLSLPFNSAWKIKRSRRSKLIAPSHSAVNIPESIKGLGVSPSGTYSIKFGRTV